VVSRGGLRVRDGVGGLVIGYPRRSPLLYAPVGAAVGAPRRTTRSDAARRGVGGNSRPVAGRFDGLTGAKQQPPPLPGMECMVTGEGRTAAACSSRRSRTPPTDRSLQPERSAHETPQPPRLRACHDSGRVRGAPSGSTHRDDAVICLFPPAACSRLFLSTRTRIWITRIARLTGGGHRDSGPAGAPRFREGTRPRADYWWGGGCGGSVSSLPLPPVWRADGATGGRPT